MSNAQPSPRTVGLLTALTALGSVSVSIYLPSLPAIASNLHASTDQAKLTLSAFLFVFAIMQLAYGPLADRFGRKPPILAGIVIYLVGSAACAAAPSMQCLIAARIVQAIGASAGPALGRAVIRDLFEGPKLTSALAIVAAAVALSPMLGPFMGGFIAQTSGWRSVFVLLAGVAGALFTWTWHSLPETGHRQGSSGASAIFHNYGRLLLDKEYAAAISCAGLLTAGNYAWNAAAPFVLADRYHVGPSLYGTLGLLVGGGYVAGTLVAMRMAKRLTAPMLVYGGLGLCVLSSALLAVAASSSVSVYTLFAVTTVFTLGMGIVLPSAAACALSRHPESAGTAAGMLGAVQIFLGALGSWVIGLFAATSVFPIAVTMAVCAVLGLYAGYVALYPFRDRKISVEASHA